MMSLSNKNRLQKQALPANVFPGVRELDDKDFKLLYVNAPATAAACCLSIITPNFNRGKLLINMLNSLLRQDCDFDGVEMLIVDDGGEAGELEQIKTMPIPFRLRYYWQPHQGRRLGRVRNIGIRQACGEIILFLDPDALASPGLIRDHLEKHSRQKRLAVIGDLQDLGPGDSPAFYRHFGMDARMKKSFAFLWHWIKRERLMHWKYLGTGKNPGLAFCGMHASARREDILAVNGSDETFDGRWGDDDFDLGCRLSKAGVAFRWTGTSFVYHQWHALSAQGVDNRLRFFLKHPETLKSRTIAQQVNPYRKLSLQDILRCHEEEEQEAAAGPLRNSGSTKVVYDNQRGCGLPKMSLIISTANRARFLEGILDSVEQQTIDPDWFEVVIADNGSTDDSAEIIRRQPRPFRLIHLWQEARGFSMGSNRNRGVAASRGGLIIMVDVDVLLPENFLEAHYQKHQEQRDLVLVGICYYMKPGEKLAPGALAYAPVYPRQVRRKFWMDETRQTYLAHLDRQGKYAFSTLGSTVHCSFRREAFDRIHGFDEEFDELWGFEDTDFFYRMGKSGLTISFFFNVPVYHRWHPWSETRLWMEENQLLFFTKHLELLKHRWLGIRPNPHFGDSHIKIRCEYVAARRFRRLGKPWRGYTAFQNFLGQFNAAWQLLLPACIYRWRHGIDPFPSGAKTCGRAG